MIERGFDSASRKFIKKICARKPLPEPKPLHKELGQHRFVCFDENKIVAIGSEQLKKSGWRRG